MSSRAHSIEQARPITATASISHGDAPSSIMAMNAAARSLAAMRIDFMGNIIPHNLPPVKGYMCRRSQMSLDRLLPLRLGSSVFLRPRCLLSPRNSFRVGLPVAIVRQGRLREWIHRCSQRRRLGRSTDPSTQKARLRPGPQRRCYSSLGARSASVTGAAYQDPAKWGEPCAFRRLPSALPEPAPARCACATVRVGRARL